jgi:hypothetical protein
VVQTGEGGVSVAWVYVEGGIRLLAWSGDGMDAVEGRSLMVSPRVDPQDFVLARSVQYVIGGERLLIELGAPIWDASTGEEFIEPPNA